MEMDKEEMKLIIYSKSGIVERIKDKWEKIGELITSE